MRIKYEIDEDITSDKDLAALLLRLNFHVIGEIDKDENKEETGIDPSIYISAVVFSTFSIMHSLLKNPNDYRGMQKMLKSFFKTFVKSMKHVGSQYQDIMSSYKN